VVPSRASVWYFIREITAEHIRDNFASLQQIAEGAAMMTGTEVERRIIGSAWPRHFNKVIADRMYEHIQAVGLPEWSEDDQAFARAVQTLVDAKELEEEGLASTLSELKGPPEDPISGGSDDIGDVSWNVPTVTLRYPSNIPGTIGHHWSSAIAMATPIAHKGAMAGAKVLAATMVDLLTEPELLDNAWTYFREEQSKGIEYEPFIGPQDEPAVEKNEAIMARYKDSLEPFYYDPSRYSSYLEQLGVEYPQLEPADD